MRPDPGTLVERGVLPKKYLRRWSGEEGRKNDHSEEKVEALASIPPRDNPNPPSRSPSSAATSTSPFPQNPPSLLSKPNSTSYPQSHCTYTTHLSPPLLTTLLTLQKQFLRDRLSSFVRASYLHGIGLAQEKHHILPAPILSHPYPCTPTPTPPITRRPSVRYLISRFSSRARDSIDGSFGEREARWGRGAEGRRRRKWERRERVGEEVEGAGRARVRRLRSFFEELSRGGGK